MMNLCPLGADKLRSTGVMSTAAVRKLFNSIGIEYYTLSTFSFFPTNSLCHHWSDFLKTFLHNIASLAVDVVLSDFLKMPLKRN